MLSHITPTINFVIKTSSQIIITQLALEIQILSTDILEDHLLKVIDLNDDIGDVLIIMKVGKTNMFLSNFIIASHHTTFFKFFVTATRT